MWRVVLLVGSCTTLAGLFTPPVGKHRVDGTLQAGALGIGEQLRMDARRLDALIAWNTRYNCKRSGDAAPRPPVGASAPFTRNTGLCELS